MYVKLAGSCVYPSTYMFKYGGDDTKLPQKEDELF